MQDGAMPNDSGSALQNATSPEPDMEAVRAENAELRERLREVDERRIQFLAVLAHELRNPLAPIRNALELIRTDSADRAAFDRTHALMERQVHRMVRLIDDLMDVSRLTRGQFVLKKEPTTLLAVLESAIETCRPAIEQAGHFLDVEMPPESIGLEADPTRLAQVVANLLDNATKFTHPGGHIILHARRRSAERIEVRIWDDGVGIPPGSLGRIFEMFTQAGTTVDRSESGLGIGLGLSRGIVELHGGTLTAHSEGVGRGSEFVIELPARPPPEPAPVGDREQPAVETQVPSTRILIVDDNVDAATSFSLLLTRRGHETRVSHDGIDAVRLAADFRPEIVFLDIGLPRLNGYEVARAIRSQWWGRSMYLVALTGWGQETDRRMTLECGIDLHLVKPLNPGSVSELVRRCRRS